MLFRGSPVYCTQTFHFLEVVAPSQATVPRRQRKCSFWVFIDLANIDDKEYLRRTNV